MRSIVLFFVVRFFGFPIAGAADFETNPRNVLILGIDSFSQQLSRDRFEGSTAPAIKALAKTGTVIQLKRHNTPGDVDVIWSQILSGLNGGKLSTAIPGSISLPNEFSLFKRLHEAKSGPRFSFVISPLDFKDSGTVYRSAAAEDAATEFTHLLSESHGKSFAGFVDLRGKTLQDQNRATVGESDKLVGMVINELKVQKLLEQTLIFVISAGPRKTNGFAISSSNKLREQGLYQDIFPTILDFFGVKYHDLDPRPNGQSLRKEPVELGLPAKKSIKVGFFYGVRTSQFYRAYSFGYFRRAGVDVSLLSKYLDDDTYMIVPSTAEEIHKTKKIATFGKVSGDQLIEELLKGTFDAVTVGETAFLKAAAGGKAIVALAELSHDRKGQPARAIVLREGLLVSSPKDLKGKTFVAKRSSGLDSILLREFFRHVGLDPDKDVSILDNYRDDEMKSALVKGKIDGGLYHISEAHRLLETNKIQIYSKFDWIDAEAAQVLLVTRKEFPKEKALGFQKIIEAVMRLQLRENLLSKTERKRHFGTKGLQIDDPSISGLNLPIMETVPMVRPEKLKVMNELLLRNKFFSNAVNIEDFIDNSFVKKATAAVSSVKLKQGANKPNAKESSP